jgi:hypothetical protein
MRRKETGKEREAWVREEDGSKERTQEWRKYMNKGKEKRRSKGRRERKSREASEKKKGGAKNEEARDPRVSERYERSG